MSGGLRLSFRQIGWSQLQHIFAHVLAGLKLDDGPLRNRNVGARIIRITADARFSDFDLENAEITQLNLFATGNSFRRGQSGPVTSRVRTSQRIRVDET